MFSKLFFMLEKVWGLSCIGYDVFWQLWGDPLVYRFHRFCVTPDPDIIDFKSIEQDE